MELRDIGPNAVKKNLWRKTKGMSLVKSKIFNEHKSKKNGIPDLEFYTKVIYCHNSKLHNCLLKDKLRK